MGVKYETNRWGERVATSTDAPGGYVPEDKAAPRPAWMQEFFDKMELFDPIKKT